VIVRVEQYRFWERVAVVDLRFVLAAEIGALDRIPKARTVSSGRPSGRFRAWTSTSTVSGSEAPGPSSNQGGT
jgi:hypothetical protein